MAEKRMNALSSIAVRTLCAVFLCLATLIAQAWSFQPKSAVLPSVAIADLPVEAQTTLELIRRGGPFPYRRDGVVFQNREKRLPDQPRGYYREYTVPTPGARDRGARRIVSGERDEYYYSSDHYRSFRRIRP